MHVLINQIAYELDAPASLADALLLAQARPPFAAAVNLQFVPNHLYAATELHAGDEIEIISPITGG